MSTYTWSCSIEGNCALRVLLGAGDDSVLVCIRHGCTGDCPHAEMLTAILLLTFIAFHCNNHWMVIGVNEKNCSLSIFLDLSPSISCCKVSNQGRTGARRPSVRARATHCHLLT